MHRSLITEYSAGSLVQGLEIVFVRSRRKRHSLESKDGGLHIRRTCGDESSDIPYQRDQAVTRATPEGQLEINILVSADRPPVAWDAQPVQIAWISETDRSELMYEVETLLSM